MQIKIPNFIVRVWDHFGDWANVSVLRDPSRALKFDIRRIDVLLVIFGIICVAWYGYTGGWRGALLGGSMYVFVAMAALWMF